MRHLYRLYGYLGLVSIFGALIWGFRYDPSAPPRNYLICAGLYLGWIGVHLGMTTPQFKRAFWGRRRGSPAERQVYILVTVATWLLIFAIHPAVPGPGYSPPEWVQFVGLLGVLVCLRSFFDGATSAILDGFIGVPGAPIAFSQGAETPLMTEGAYARVRHPMYRAAVFGGLASLLIHPHMGQALWGAMIGLTFVAFIPIEERLLIAARGDEYRTYCQKTRYRLFAGVW